MALLSIQGIDSPLGYVPDLIGDNLGQSQTVTQQEAATALRSRGYNIQPARPPIIPPTTPPLQAPPMSRAAAIAKALDESLAAYRMSKRCTKLGGCKLTENKFNAIARRAAPIATRYLRASAVTPRTPSLRPSLSPSMTRMPATRPSNITPATLVPPRTPAPVFPRFVAPATPGARPAIARRGVLAQRLRGISGTLHGLGQDVTVAPPIFPGWEPVQTAVEPAPVETPGMTIWDWVSVISETAKGGLSVLQVYSDARAQRERVGQTATLTAAQIKTIVNEALIQNPALNKTKLEAAAAGAAGAAIDKLPKGMPAWVLPVVVGSAVVAVMSMTKR